MEVVSVYDVTELRKKTGTIEEFAGGAGQIVIRGLRKKYPGLVKFVLRGFQINGEFVPLFTFKRRRR